MTEFRSTSHRPLISERVRWLICGKFYVFGSVLMTTAAWCIRCAYQGWIGEPPPIRVEITELLIGAAVVSPYFRWAQWFCYGDRFDKWGACAGRPHWRIATTIQGEAGGRFR